MPTKRNGEDLLIQYYQGEHKDEYTLISEQEVRHYQNGVLKGLWEVRNGEIIGTFKIFDNGCVQYCQDWNTLKEGCWIRTVNKKLGCMKEIVDSKTQKVIYRGGIGDNGKRKGRGIEFDSKSGNIQMEGIWLDDELKRIIRLFDGDKMTEFKNTGDNTDVSSRIPIYVGEYSYNETHNTCFRNGRGFQIGDDGIAESEGKWENGIEVEKTLLTKGWYKVEEDNLKYPIDSESIVIPAYKHKFDSYVDLSKYKEMKTISIEEHNFWNTDHFHLRSIDSLETVEIGNYSFYKDDRTNRMNRTFSIVDCSHLRSIQIGSFSFQYYSGAFALSRLPSLELIQIGLKEQDSYCFWYSNFIVKGKALECV